MGARMQSLGGVLTAQVLATHLYAELPLVSLSAASVHQGRVVYRIDQDLGPIGLVINECGVFAVRGALERFSGTLVLDRADRLDARLDLALDAASVALSGQEGLNWQPLALWFAGREPRTARDVAAHPMIRFRTSAVAPAGRSACSMAAGRTLSPAPRWWTWRSPDAWRTRRSACSATRC
jgi:polyisoprenoid-binding protein YceI